MNVDVRHFACYAIALTIIMILSLGGIAQAQNAQHLDLLRRAVNPNPTLQSYVASAHLSAQLHALVPIRKSFEGTVYYLKPRRKVVFDAVSGPLSKFEGLTTTTPTYDQAFAEYSITLTADNGVASQYSLVPRKSGKRVTNLTVTVNDRTALIVRAVWTYTNGAVLRFDQTYENIGAFCVPAAEIITARFPGYSADGTLTFSGYRLNAPVSSSIFDTKE